ncbi:hypothetical protein SCHPADRAFT_933847 [Schizopora paradoxa]|uniref:Uncharacterized protein n=1 Tax=Schizopora paradoxa TaxID=27342 RepID=A0A0H2RJL7_9AGAM|nr:hypothetical protein SCHPADRAFT_933847 [Schizopora paradoxa]
MGYGLGFDQRRQVRRSDFTRNYEPGVYLVMGQNGEMQHVVASSSTAEYQFILERIIMSSCVPRAYLAASPSTRRHKSSFSFSFSFLPIPSHLSLRTDDAVLMTGRSVCSKQQNVRKTERVAVDAAIRAHRCPRSSTATIVAFDFASSRQRQDALMMPTLAYVRVAA